MEATVAPEVPGRQSGRGHGRKGALRAPKLVLSQAGARAGRVIVPRVEGIRGRASAAGVVLTSVRKMTASIRAQCAGRECRETERGAMLE
jgi:hypothetical protein